VASATTAAAPGSSIVKSLLDKDSSLLNKLQQHRQLPQQQQQQRSRALSHFAEGDAPAFLNGQRVHRFLEDDGQTQCDAAFLGCLPSVQCVDCFATLELEGIDWTGVTPDTECPDVVKFLTAGGHCQKLEGNDEAIDTFCATFSACVVWEVSDDDDDDDAEPDEAWVNCTALTECKWEGMKENWIGDGICHDNMHGCYNTALCKYDGGDCCKDTCKDGDSEYNSCGHDGYACRDPEAKECDSALTAKCPDDGKKEDKKDDVKCEEGEVKYRVVMYDSFGDGWDKTSLTITPKDKKKPVYSGSLDDGSEGTEYLCLSKDATCYTAETNGGTWGVEVSWELKPMKDGSPALAGSGAPDTCDFPVAGAECEKTCNGRPEADPTDDPDYKSFKELYNCISDKCVIQLGACENDDSCEQCFAENAPEYCFGIDTFVAVIDCTVCSCTDKQDSDFCTEKPGPGGSSTAQNDEKDDDNSAPQKCTPQETMQGAKSVMDFGQCTDLDEIGMMVTEFDQSNFGQLDTFEACAHSFTDEENQGGHTALGCMKILYDTMTNPIVKDNPDAPKDAIAALAKNLYQNAEPFCDCAKKGSESCPLCPSFMSFKTLMYESMDACKALDEIDCGAWVEFWKPCKDNLETEFKKSDFTSKDQCAFAKEKQCGGAGTFPAFRKLDCGKEIDKDAWDFYKSYAKNCLKGDDGKPPDDTPVAKPTQKPASSPTKAPSGGKPTSGTKPTAKPYVPSDGPAKPYAPSSDSKEAKKKKSHWFRNLLILGVLGGIGYHVYKTRFDTFNFVQYRRTGGGFGNSFGNFGNFSNPFNRGGGGGGSGYEYGDTGGMYTNLNSSTTFEPPTLPPTPMMMGTELT